MKAHFFTLYLFKKNLLRAPSAPIVRHFPANFQGGGGGGGESAYRVPCRRAPRDQTALACISWGNLHLRVCIPTAPQSKRHKIPVPVIQPNLVLAEVYSLTLVPMDTEAQALIQILQSILDH